MPVYEVKVTSHFAAAHQLKGFHGGCENLHGHNWKVEVVVAGEALSPDGLLVDFRDVKEATRNVLETLDHRFLNELPPFDGQNPSSENIARHIFKALEGRLALKGVRVSRVTAWESDSACATYAEP